MYSNKLTKRGLNNVNQLLQVPVGNRQVFVRQDNRKTAREGLEVPKFGTLNPKTLLSVFFSSFYSMNTRYGKAYL